MKKPKITIDRVGKGENTTFGNVYVNGKKFCYSLEDTVRTGEEKIYGRTAIPAAQYMGKITYSPTFGRDTIQVYNEPDMSIEADGKSFQGVRIHGGNTHEDTLGCPLVAYYIAQEPVNGVGDYKIFGTAEKMLTHIVKKAGGECVIEIKNSFER